MRQERYAAPCVQIIHIKAQLPMATSIEGDLTGLGSNTLQETGGDGIQLARGHYWEDDADDTAEW